MKVQIFDGGSVSEVEIAQVVNFGELKSALTGAGTAIDYDAKSVVVKPGNTTLELNEAVIPVTDNLIVFLFPKRTKSGATEIESLFDDLLIEIVTITAEYIVENYEYTDSIDTNHIVDAVRRRAITVAPADPAIAALQNEYNRMREQL